MITEEITAGFNVCASICGQDGLISEVEELTIINKFTSIFELTRDEVEQLFEEFFNSTEHVDEYLAQVVNSDLRLLIYEISKQSAASDDLDIRENIALERARLTWGLDTCL